MKPLKLIAVFAGLLALALVIIFWPDITALIPGVNHPPTRIGGGIVVHDTVRIIEHDTIEVESATVSTDPSGFSFETKMAQAKKELAKKGLTFEEVKTLHEEIIMSADAEEYKQADPTTYQSLIDYFDIVTWIVGGNTGKLDAVLFQDRRTFNIADHHRENLHKIFYKNTRKVNTDYKARYRSFNSFQELDSIRQGVVGHL